MKLTGGKLKSAGALLLFAIFLTAVVSACGGGGSSSSTTTTAPAEEETTEAAEEEAGGETAAWSLPNVNVQNTRAIESAITPENVSTLKPAWAITVNGAGAFG